MQSSPINMSTEKDQHTPSEAGFIIGSVPGKSPQSFGYTPTTITPTQTSSDGVRYL